MPVYADMVKVNACYLCSPSIPPHPVRITRQLKLNTNLSDRTVLEILAYFYKRIFRREMLNCDVILGFNLKKIIFPA